MNERTTTRSDDAERLERVFSWLADHLDDTPDLTWLAEVACLSPYHFHRVYRAMQGETAADTVRRLRLHRAAVELITGELPIPRIARRAGYGSQEAFTRGFKAAYAVPPARYRASFVPPQTAHRQEDAMEATTTYEATIRSKPALRVAALAHHGDYQSIGSTFDRLMALAAGQRLLGTRHAAHQARNRDLAAAPLKRFDNEWIFDAFAGRPTFFTKRIFGGLAAYLHERQMLVLVEPTKTGRWKWHGVLVCTGREHQASISADFPALTPHAVLQNWLYVDTSHQDFEATMEGVARRMARNDRRFGIAPSARRGEPSGSPGRGGPKGPPLRRRTS